MTNKSSQPENQPKADDRNIVSLDSSYEGANLEDKLFLFWHNYKSIIVGVTAVAVLALAGWGILSVLQSGREARIQSEYQQAVTSGELVPFAEKNVPHELAGVAYLQAADKRFEEKAFTEAAELYGKAAENLDDAAFVGRAQVGRGVALALTGDQEAALVHLEEVARDAGNLGATRAEAHYHAASLAVELEQYDVARTHIDEVMQLDRSQIWASRAMSLQRSLPAEAPAAETEPAAEAASQ